MNANRSGLTLRPIFAPFMLSFFLGVCAIVLVNGCASQSAVDPSTEITTLPARETLEAGSMALYMQGLLYESATNTAPEMAAEAYTKALELNPYNQSALAALANTLTQQQRHAESLRALVRYLDNFPENTELRAYAVQLADHLKKPAVAARFCQQILIHDPTNQPVAQAAIQYSFASGAERDALATMRRFTAKIDSGAALRFSLETALALCSNSKVPEQAVKCCAIAREFAASNEEQSDVMMVEGYCQLEAAQTNNAVQSFKASYRLNPQNYIALNHLGVIFAAQPKLLRKLEGQCAAGARDTQPPLELILGYAYLALEQPEKAAPVLTQYYQRRMREGYFADRHFYLLLGSTCELLKAYEQIDQLFADALCAFPDDPEILNFAAYLWSERGVNLEQALKFINAALRQSPDNAAFLDTKGWVLHKMERNFEALQLLLKACAIENQEPVILDHTGDVLNTLGHEVLALDFWMVSYLNDPQPAVADKLTKLGVPLPKE
ncbi:MAG: tetratricopeptide repeat protein [Kiritimatiellae bacterium]|nr:tetratricopeptide repeat protein [Kiritimatiellia bacterium]